MTTPYTQGTASVTAGSAIVTGTGTGWQTSGLRAGIFGANGIAVPVASIDSDTQITLALDWPGATASGQEYWITYDTEPGQQTVSNAQRLAEYIARLNNPALAATASVTPSANKVLLFTGATTATLIDVDDLIQAFKFDAEVPTLAGRAAYDAQPKGFKVLVADIGDGRSAFYTKLSNTSADWSVPFYISGTVGPAGVANPRGTYAAGTAYAKNDLVLDNGSSWIAKVATTGNAPPTLPTTSNTWWQLAAAKGTDGTGTGDVSGPAGGVTVKQVAGFGSVTGKAIVGLTAAEVRSAGQVPVGQFRNKLITPLFNINQRAVSGTVTLAAGAYGHDRMKAGASGCTYSFSTNNGVTTLNITAGSLQQVIEALAFAGEPGSYVLSWSGTAQGRINSGSYGASGLVLASVDGSANVTVEFNMGTLSLAQFERDYVTPFSARNIQQETALCQRYYAVVLGTARWPAPGFSIMETPLFWPVTMRTTPSLTQLAGGAIANATISLIAGGPTGGRFLITAAAAGDSIAVGVPISVNGEL
ncbi:hypothetical protein RMR21_005630 [Agrobacterium sp. rho-8.1]|nr:hypothetical protein [Agrobacterium sp. rho-8.1]